MIHCSKCGTANQDGNRFCSQCGGPLQSAGVRCPMCGAMNPASNVQCEKCDARLTPLIAQPRSGVGPYGTMPQEPPSITPLKREGEPPVEAEDASGDWLSQLRAPTAEEEGFEEPVAEEAAGDWLSQLRAPTAEEERFEEPVAEEAVAGDWLTQLRAPTAEEERFEEPVAEEAVAGDWLTQLRTPTAEEKRFEEPEAEEEVAGDWLSQLRTPTVEEPDSIAEPVEPAELPDWLREAEAPPIEPAPEPTQVSDWLKEMAPLDAQDTEVSEFPPLAVAEAAPEEAFPRSGVRAVAGATPRHRGPYGTAPEDIALEPEVSDWLREMSPPDAPELPSLVAETAPEEALPRSGVGPYGTAPEDAILEPEVPDWLREMAPPDAPEIPPLAAEAAPEEAFPAEPASGLDGVPDWLKEMEPLDAQDAEAPPLAAEAVPEEAFPEEPESGLAGVPDWLREMEPLDAEPPEAPPPTVEAAPEEIFPRSGVGPYGTAPTELATEPEVPDWLREMPPPDAQDVETDEEALLTELAPEPAEIPDWLQELGPPKEKVPLVLPLPAELAEGLAHAEIPGWLEALRPRPVADVAAIEEEPEETEGLLKGLRGLLSPASAIEALPIHARTLPAESSEASLARAQLLQSLLIQPAEEPQPEVRKRSVRISELVQRLLVLAALLVVVGVLLAPWMMSDVPTLTKPAGSPEADRRASFQRLKRMHSTIQSVSSRDIVLVAFEYGPAEADELNLVAEPILRHLLDRGTHISAVSTRPEGLTVAAGLLSSIVTGEQYTGTQYTLWDYRPGGATGVLQLLAEAGTRPSLLLVLTAQPAPLRWWVEQTRARPDTLPIVAGVSAVLESATSPYLDASAGQLKGAVHGLSEAAAYEKLYRSSGQATQRLDALAAGHIAIVSLMIIGAILHTLGGLRRGGK